MSCLRRLIMPVRALQQYSWGDDINSSRANYNWDGGSTDGTILNKPVMWVSMLLGAFDIRQMSGNGFMTGMLIILPERRSNPEKKSKCCALPDSFPDIGFRIAFQKVLPDTANPELVLFGGLRVMRFKHGRIPVSRVMMHLRSRWQVRGYKHHQELVADCG